MNDLLKLFQENTGRYIHKAPSYLEIYDKLFSRYRGKDVVMVEIGIDHGGSLELWKKYFGDNSLIVGVDKNDYTPYFDQVGIQTYQCLQDDIVALEDFKATYPKVDIILDDGSHYGKDQIASFNSLFPHVSKDGIYIVEDLHASYYASHDGGLKRDGTFIEFSKDLIDLLNQWSWSEAPFSTFCMEAIGIHFYPSVCVIEKGKGDRASPTRIGTKRIGE